MNKITLVGTLGRDAELLAGPNTNRVRLRVAVNEYMGQDKEEKTHWVNVTAFGSLADNAAATLKKGHRVVIYGKIDTYVREVQIDGEAKNIGEVSFIAEAIGPDLRFQEADVRKGVSGSSRGSGQQSNQGQQSAPAAAPVPAAAPAAASDDDF